MQTFLFLLELAGTVAFAVSGAVLGIEKHMDIFGVGLLGITTAVGGGILRDLVVGLTPPRAFQDPMYLLVALGVLRDVLAGDMPYILRKHIYASASIVGGILYLLLRQVWHGPGAILTGVLVVVGIRCAAAHFEWNLPRAKTVWKSDE